MRSELVRIEEARPASSVLIQRLVRQLLEDGGLRRKRGVPESLDPNLFEDSRRKSVLVRRWKLGGRVEGLLELVGHATNLWEER